MSRTRPLCRCYALHRVGCWQCILNSAHPNTWAGIRSGGRSVRVRVLYCRHPALSLEFPPAKASKHSARLVSDIEVEKKQVLAVMGIPKFYRWMSERYPCLSQVVNDYQVCVVMIVFCVLHARYAVCAFDSRVTRSCSNVDSIYSHVWLHIVHAVYEKC